MATKKADAKMASGRDVDRDGNLCQFVAVRIPRNLWHTVKAAAAIEHRYAANFVMHHAVQAAVRVMAEAQPPKE